MISHEVWIISQGMRGNFPERLGCIRRNSKNHKKIAELSRKLEEFSRMFGNFSRSLDDFPRKANSLLKSSNNFPGSPGEFLVKTEDKISDKTSQ